MGHGMIQHNGDGIYSSEAVLTPCDADTILEDQVLISLIRDVYKRSHNASGKNVLVRTIRRMIGPARFNNGKSRDEAKSIIKQLPR